MGRSFLGSLATAGRGLINRTPVPYTSGRNISIPWRQPTGTEAQMRAMGSVGTLFAIVNRTSNATAQVNWRLYRKAASGREEDRTEVTSHAALDLLNQPNKFFTRQELIESTQQHIDLTGEGWWVITRNQRSPIPLELWPVRPDRMAPIPDPRDFIRGYTYTTPDGGEIQLRVEDVIFIRMPNPLDPYRGLGPVQSIMTEIDASRYSAEWNRNFFLNSAEPGGIIEVPNVLSDPQFDQLRDRWNEQHRGVANAHRVAILEHGKWVDRRYTQRDMQFAELHQVSRDVMREAFGAPAFILGEVQDVNRATGEASKVLFAEQLTIPRLERFKGALNNDLLPLYGKDTARLLEFDYEDPVPLDADARNTEITTKANAAKLLIDAGLDPAAVLEYLDLPPMAYTPPVTLQPPASAPAPAASEASAPAARTGLHKHPIPYRLPARWDGPATAFRNTEETSMGRGYRATNRADSEALARAARPALAVPDGTQSWYRITNAMEGPDGPGMPCLYIYGDIGSWGITAAQCVRDLSEIDAPVIDVYINSPGGEVFDGLAIYNALRSHPAKVMVRVDSLAASIASVIAMAGDHVTMSPGSQMMIHDANGVACGEPAELRKYADFLDAQSDNIASIYAERAGGTAGQWRKRMQAETWYFADEAVAAGLADEVGKPMRQDATAEAAAMAASWDLTVYNYAHTSRDEAPAPILNTACPTHHTATEDRPWDAGPNEKRLPSPMTLSTAKKMYAYYDSGQVDNGEIVKAACKLPHHEVSADGTPGAANLAGVRNALSRLPQSDIPAAEHDAIRRHLQAHLDDGKSASGQADDEPLMVAFDPDVFRTAAHAALDPMPGYEPDHLRSLMGAVAEDAPAPPVREQVAPLAAADSLAAADPVAPPPASEIAVDYFRTLMANAANDLAAPTQAAAPGPEPAEPIPAIDRKRFERSLREAEL